MAITPFQTIGTKMIQYHDMTTKVKTLTGSRKKQFRICAGDVCNVDSYWDGGSRSYYAVINIDTGMQILPQGNHPFGAHGRLGYKLITGDVLIGTGTFSGKPATPGFTCKEADMDRVLAFLGVSVLPSHS